MGKATGAKRDSGKGLDQVKIPTDGFAGYNSHWRIEGYDVYLTSAWEGTHTSRTAEIKKDGVTVETVRLLSDARAWIRKQVGK